MSASGGTRAIIAAFLANMGIAADEVHRVVLLGLGVDARRGRALGRRRRQPAAAASSAGARRRRQADKEHPFGYGRERYVYAFVVSIILFSVGGLFSIYEGVDKLTHPHELENAWLPIARALDRDRARVVLAAHRGQGVQPRRARRPDLGAVRAPREGARAARRAARRRRARSSASCSRSSASASR